MCAFLVRGDNRLWVPTREGRFAAHALGDEGPPQEHAVLSFAAAPELIRPLVSDVAPAAVAERLPSQPRATQRVDTSGVEPRWVEAHDFDIRNHVRRHVVPVCQSRDDLWNAVSALT